MPDICFIADSHRRHRELAIPDCDILIHCGDIGSFNQDEKDTLDDIDLWFAEQPAKHVLCVPGNHDFGLESGYEFKNARLLEDSHVEIEGLKIYGSPWVPMLAGFAYFLEEGQLLEKWKQIPENTDVLVTHTPPYGILDLPSSKARHLGCPQLREEFGRINPRIHAFGHIHASYGIHEEGSTKFLNAAVVGGREFEVRNLPIFESISI